MTVEIATNIEGLQADLPRPGDVTNEGDDHIRTIKSVMKLNFPGASGDGFAVPITATEEELNWLAGLTSNVQEQIDALVAGQESLEWNLSAPAGTIMLFRGSTPVGWTLVDESVSGENSMLRVVNAISTGSGGLDSPILNNKAPAHTHTVSQDMAGGHGHSISGGYNYILSCVPSFAATMAQDVCGDVNDVISDVADHTHSVVVNANDGSAWEPRYIDTHMAVKDAPE